MNVNQFGLPCVPYLTFSQCVLQNQHERIAHVPTQNCMKYDLCRTETPTELLQKTKTIGKSVKTLRQWKHSKNISNSGDSSRKKGFIFKLLCYNVLAQSLLEEHPYLYQEHVQENLKWKRRWKNLKQEITEQDPDIICMQEVQETHLTDYFNITFDSLGYKSLYKKRTGYKVDGCAIFWKNDILDLLEYETVEFNQNHSTAIDRDNVAIIAKFVPRLYPKAEFIVATTHLLYNPRREDIRMAQVQLLLTELDRLAYKLKCKDENDTYKYVPVILTGDFNTQPFSPVYELITSGKFEYQYHHLFMKNRLLSPHLGITDTCQHIEILKKRMSKEPGNASDKHLTQLQHRESNFYPVRKSPSSEHKGLFCSGQLSHQLKLKSVFKHNLGDKREATTYQDEWVTVDYIFYSNVETTNNKVIEKKLKVMSRYTIPTEDQLNNVKIPNSEIGSDHLLLAAKFVIQE
ncbi:protein angel homolog 2 [Agrilus planipennis]|uniref:Protein angel homolog 2 n=1 Tax=Agrilus planipennis TaxID=224129 RepID=A0A1W4WIV4_AGRPL|nr:protein angel homolog 2 [Agrilus planipennis]